MLDFKELVSCFGLCTKNQLRERLCAMLSSWEDKNRKVSSYAFEKTIKGVCKIAPQSLKGME
jgi:hypothetical protein